MSTSTRPIRTKSCHPLLIDNIHKVRKELRAAERKCHESRDASDLDNHQFLLSAFSSTVTAAKKAFCKEKVDNATGSMKLFST